VLLDAMMWTLMVIIGSALLVLSGALCLYTRDIAWDLISWMLERLGFVPERTRVWNIMITLYGIAALVIGVYALIQVFKEL
jgi:hypothetical protein